MEYIARSKYRGYSDFLVLKDSAVGLKADTSPHKLPSLSTDLNSLNYLLSYEPTKSDRMFK